MFVMSSIMQKCNDDNIPLADDDPQVIITDDVENNRLDHGRSMDSLPSSYTGGSSSPGLNGPPSFEPDSGIDEQEEKARLISQVLELQNTLDGKLNVFMEFRNALLPMAKFLSCLQRINVFVHCAEM